MLSGKERIQESVEKMKLNKTGCRIVLAGLLSSDVFTKAFIAVALSR